jgi:hypothetical protein
MRFLFPASLLFALEPRPGVVRRGRGKVNRKNGQGKWPFSAAGRGFWRLRLKGYGRIA